MDRARRAEPSCNRIITQRIAEAHHWQHMVHVRKVKSVVDTKGPKLKRFVNWKKLQMQEDRSREIDRQNKHLLSKMQEIIMRPQMDLGPVSYKGKSNWVGRQADMMHIMRENHLLLSRLKRSKSQFSVRQWQRDREHMETVIRGMSMYDEHGKIKGFEAARRRARLGASGGGSSPGSPPSSRPHTSAVAGGGFRPTSRREEGPRAATTDMPARGRPLLEPLPGGVSAQGSGARAAPYEHPGSAGEAAPEEPLIVRKGRQFGEQYMIVSVGESPTGLHLEAFDAQSGRTLKLDVAALDTGVGTEKGLARDRDTMRAIMETMVDRVAVEAGADGEAPRLKLST